MTRQALKRAASAALLVLTALPASARAAATTERVSVSSAGAEANAPTVAAVISGDGRYVAFSSRADNLVPGDTNGYVDVFVRDRVRDRTVRVSVGRGRRQANGASGVPRRLRNVGERPFGVFATVTQPLAISADGRFVAFVSRASNLVRGDRNGAADVFIRDRARRRTRRVDVAWNGAQANARALDVSISADGRYVAFSSAASNLVRLGDRNRQVDVFVRDRDRRTTTLASVDLGRRQASMPSVAPAISARGRFVAFQTGWGAFGRAEPEEPGWNVWRRDRLRGELARANVRGGRPIFGASDGRGALGPSISGSGDLVAFAVQAFDELYQVLARRFADRRTEWLSRPDGGIDGEARDAAISQNGRFAAFVACSGASPPGTIGCSGGHDDVFRRDRLTDTTLDVTVPLAGAPDGASSDPSISRRGRFVAFLSAATNLVPGDANAAVDVFVRGPLPRE